MAFIKLTRPESVRIEYNESTDEFEMIGTDKETETEIYVNTRYIAMFRRDYNEPYTRLTLADACMDIAVIELPYEIARRIRATELEHIS
jgi:hypothetical protein